MAHKLVTGSVYFVDLRNFTLLCSRMPDNPQEDQISADGQSQYAARLNFLVEEMTGLYRNWSDLMERYVSQRRIRRYLFQVLGDGVMIALEGPEHAQVALESATEVGQTLVRQLEDRTNPRLKELGVARRADLLDFGIGLCSGEFAYVEVPIRLHKNAVSVEPTILGTAANYASRIEKSNKDHVDTHITIAQPTIDALCGSLGINPKDHRAVEDALGLRFAWRHRFSGVKEIGLYFKVLDR